MEIEEPEQLVSMAIARRPEQVFDYFVVMDFEATCDETKETVKPQEIIEFPSVLLDCRAMMLGKHFQTYVKPLFNPTLTTFCRRLTGIQQTQVDNGISLQEALHRHDLWLESEGVKRKKFVMLTWGDWDLKTMLEKECKLKSLQKPTYFNRWINLKRYAGRGGGFGLRAAVEAFGLKWTGRAHSGLDDATNTARLALELMRQGIILTITGSLRSKQPNWLEASSHGVGGSTSSVGADAVECYCGEACKRQMVTNAGDQYGKIYLVCRKWTPTLDSGCGFSAWA